MSGGNKYILNLHHNSPNLPGLHSDDLAYRVASDKYLLAIYDETYYSLYKAGQSKGTYYGTLTTNCYSFDGKEFKFLIAYPELGKSATNLDQAKFALGKIILGTDEQLFLESTANGNKLCIYDRNTNTSHYVHCPISIGLPNDFSLHEIKECTKTTPGGSINILSSDITPDQTLDIGKEYWLDPDPNDNTRIKLTTSDASPTLVGHLNNTTTLMQETGCVGAPGSQSCNYHLWHGNPFINVINQGVMQYGNEKHKEKIPDNAKIALSRDGGKVKYEFIDSQGKVIQAGENFCNSTKTPDCKMEKLNLIPNIRTYLKSTLTSADIGDFDNKASVDAAGVALILKNTIIDEVAADQTLQKAVSAALRLDPGKARGPEGRPGMHGLHGGNGQDGKSPSAADIANELIADPNLNVLLSIQVAKESELQTGVKDLLKSDITFIAGLKGTPGKAGLDGVPGPRGPAGPQGISGPQGVNGQNGKSPSAADVANELIADPNLNVLSTEVAKKSELQEKVAEALRDDPGKAIGPEGPTGKQGPIGPTGAQGQKGEDAVPSKVAEKLVTDQVNKFKTIIFEEPIPAIKGKTLLEYIQKEMPVDIAQDTDMQNAVIEGISLEIVNRLAHSSRFKRSLKGEDGEKGDPGPAGLPGSPGKAGLNGAIGPQGPKGDKGDQGPEGLRGIQGLPGSAGVPGTDADPTVVAEKLVTAKADKLGAAVLDATGSGGNLATQVADKVNLNKKEFLNQVDTDKLAETLLRKSGITQSEAKNYIQTGKNVSTWGLAKHLITHSGLDANGARGFVETKVSQERLAHDLLKHAGLDNDAGEANATIDHILNHFFSTRVGTITAALRNNPGRARGPRGEQGDKGDDGIQGEQGQDADPSEIMNRLAHNTRLKRSLKGDDGHEGPEGKQGDKGEDGLEGIPGLQGPAGSQGLAGQNADSSEIMNRLAHNFRFKRSLKGDDGPEGPEGKQGDKGEDGSTGPRGRDGKHGKKGDDGPEGLEGKQGNKGEDGSAGPRGRDGKHGKKGDDGPEGPEGKQGDKGEDGSAGPRGRDGKHGKKGDDGPEGQEGKQGDKGEDGSTGPRGRDGKQGKKGDQGEIGDDGMQGEQGQDADPSEIAHRLAHNTRLKRSLKGDDGPEGERGKDGAPGLPGPAGKDGIDGATGSEISHRLAHSTRFTRPLKGDDGPEGLRGEQGDQGPQGPEGKQGDKGEDGSAGPRGRDGKHGKKGDDGPEGQEGKQGDKGEDGSTGPRGRDGKQGKKGDQGEIGDDGMQGEQGQDADPSEIAHRLAHNTRLKRSLKGDDGPEGPEGKQGDKGEDGATGPRGRDGKHGKRGDDDVESLLKNLMEDGVDIFSPDARSKRSAAEFQQKLQLKITQGESYDQDKNEANIELEMEGKSIIIATFLEIGYFFKNDDLYIRNHITGKNILIPKNFHFLKVVEDGLDNYKLAFCNNLGNLFFDHKKYDPEYADVPEEHKLIDLKYIKNAANIDLSKYYYHTHTPLFAVKQGELEGHSLEDYRADVYEIGKDKKIGTLVDEFGFFENGKFHHIDYHHGSDEHSEELDVRIEDYEGNFQIGDNTIHPITLYDGHLDLIDYLGYSVNL